MESTLALLRITERHPAPANALIWELFHSGRLNIGGREIRLGVQELPVPRVQGEAVVWKFSKPVKVATPGPDANLNEISQYRDRIEFTVWPWADVVIKTE